MRPPNPLARPTRSTWTSMRPTTARLGVDPIDLGIAWAFRWLPTSKVDVVSFAIAGPVVPKARARVYLAKGVVRAVTPKRTRAYEERIRWEAIASLGKISWKKGGLFALRVIIHTTSNRRADIDNVLKSVMDALTGALWADDRQVIEAHVYLGDKVSNGITVDVVRTNA